MRLILLGLPGAGKGTQAHILADQLGLLHISTGDMFREAAANGTELGLKAQEFMSKGELVPDEVTIGMLLERIAQPDAANGFLLDGFPRTVPQAEALGAALGEENALDAVVLLEVPDELIVERTTGRRTDPVTKRIYHVKYDPPPAEVADRVVQRPDDTEESCRARLAKYHAATAPVVPIYEAQGLLRRVNGVGTPDEVSARIVSALEG